MVIAVILEQPLKALLLMKVAAGKFVVIRASQQFEYLTHAPDFIREFHKDSRGILIEYDELKELGRQGWELVTAQPGGKWIFKREATERSKLEQGKPIKPSSPDYDRSW